MPICYPVPDAASYLALGNPNSTSLEIRIEVREFSLDKAMPQFGKALNTRIDCDKVRKRSGFVKEELHALRFE